MKHFMIMAVCTGGLLATSACATASNGRRYASLEDFSYNNPYGFKNTCIRTTDSPWQKAYKQWADEGRMVLVVFTDKEFRTNSFYLAAEKNDDIDFRKTKVFCSMGDTYTYESKGNGTLTVPVFVYAGDK